MSLIHSAEMYIVLGNNEGNNHFDVSSLNNSAYKIKVKL